MSAGDGAAGRFWDEFRQLYKAAGAPTLASLVRLGKQQVPPAIVSDAALSEWLTGKGVPSRRNSRVFLALVAVLQARARSGHAYEPRSEGWWQRLLAQAQDERSAAQKAGRPRRPDGPELTPVRLAQRKPAARYEGQSGTVGSRGDLLPLAADADLSYRLHRAVLELPYIHRDVEVEVRMRLNAGDPVLLVGPSMVGKTKMAAILIKEMFAARPVLIPETPEALASLESLDIHMRESVILLDDIDHLIGTRGITYGVLQRLLAADNIVIGTIRAAVYDRLQPTDQLRPPEWDVLSGFKRVFLTRDLSYAELQRLHQIVADPDVQERVREVGIGEYVGSAERIEEALRLGPSTSPVGLALVRGAADWQRSGMTRPVPARVLRDLAKPHLSARHRVKLSDRETYRAALAWATRDINPTVALLQQTERNAYVVYDYALDLVSAQAQEIPEPIWLIVINQAAPDELVSIGSSAIDYSKFDIAMDAFSKAADSGDLMAESHGSAFVGALLQEQGDLRGAKAAYRRAIDSRHAKVGSTTKFNIGYILEGLGDMRGAKTAYQQAVRSGHAQASPKAALALGRLLAEEGNSEAAKRAFQQAIISGHDDAAPGAALGLGVLLAKEGNVEGAEVAFQRAIDSGHDDVAPKAAVQLAGLMASRGELLGAEAAYQQAIDSGHLDATPFGMFYFASFLERQGEVERAIAAYQQAIDSGHANAAPLAMFYLAELLERHGDAQGAIAAYQQAIDSGHADHAPAAAFRLGILLSDHEDVDGAIAAYKQAIDSGHSNRAPNAALALGVLLTKQGQMERAKEAYQRAIDSGHGDAAPRAALIMGSLLAEQGDVEGAKAVYQQVINSGNVEVIPSAALSLGTLAMRQDNADEARAFFQKVIDSGDADYAPMAAAKLGMVLAKQGDADGAKVAFRYAIDSENNSAVALGAIGLGALLEAQGDTEGAKVEYQRAIDSGDAATTEFARERMEEILDSTGGSTESAGTGSGR